MRDNDPESESIDEVVVVSWWPLLHFEELNTKVMNRAGSTLFNNKPKQYYS